MEKQLSFKIPYNKGYEVITVPEKNLLGVFNPVWLDPLADPHATVREEIRRELSEIKIMPVDTSKSKVAIAVTDRTRVTPNKLFLSVLLEELNLLGIVDDNITILIGTGMHAPDSQEDIANNCGQEIQKRLQVLNNRPLEKDLHVECGRTSYGTPVQVHKVFAAGDLKIATGNITPCLMAGWTGGGKTVLPGITSQETIYSNHKLFTDQLKGAERGALLGVLPPANIVRSDIEEAADLAGLHMVINSVLNYDHSLVRVLAGHQVKVHRQGVEVATKGLQALFPRKADIIVSGVGLGFDISLYQGGSRVLQSLDGVIKEEGTVIFACACREGIYEGILQDVYRRWMERMPTPREIEELVRANELPPEDGVVLYVFSWLIHKLRCKIILVTEGLSKEETERVHMTHDTSLQKALDRVLSDHGGSAEVAVLPYGSMMLPRVMG